MKSILGAFALAFAAPAIAQDAPVAGPHAGHDQHHDHGGGQQSGHAGHDEHKMDCCEKMKQQKKRMECCDEHGKAPADAPADHSQHDH